MSGKIAGALLLLLACAMISARYIGEKRRAIRLAEAFAAALCRMEGMIRWQNLPLPRVLEQESQKKPCGEYFSEISQYIKSGCTLHSLWQETFARIPESGTRDLLCRLDLQGDAQQVMGALHLTAEELRAHAAEMAQRQRQNERLWVAASGCITAVLIIVLI